jgi:hypothetical protein
MGTIPGEKNQENLKDTAIKSIKHSYLHNMEMPLIYAQFGEHLKCVTTTKTQLLSCPSYMNVLQHALNGALCIQVIK